MIDKFKNLKIGKRLKIVFSTMSIMFLVFFLLALFGIGNVASNVEGFREEAYTNTMAALKAKESFESIQKVLYQAVTAKDLDTTNQKLEEVVSYSAVFNENFDTIKKSSPNDQELLDNMAQIITESADTRNKIIELAKNKDSTAIDILNEEYMTVIDEAREILDTIVVHANEEADSYITSSNRIKWLTIGIQGALFVLIVIFIWVLHKVIYKSITKPIDELENAAREISLGNLSTKILYNRPDELGSLADSLRNTISVLSSYITNISYVLRNMAGKNMDITIDLEYIGDFSEIRESMEKILESMNRTLGKMGETAQLVNSSADQIAQASQTIAEGAMDQSSALEQLMAMINEVDNQVNDNASSAKNVSHASRESVTYVENGNQYMQRLLEVMQRIIEKAEEISSITKVVDEISSETNLLSLNASIEAARAGEHGAGFAVVANEIGNLANATARETQNIGKLVEETLCVVKEGSELASETADMLNRVVNATDETNESITRISEACGHQAESLDEVVKGIKQISDVVMTNSSVSEETSASSEELLSHTQSVTDMISEFRLR